MRAMYSDDELLQSQLESLTCTPSSNTSVGKWISCSSSICMSLPKPVHSSTESENSSELDQSASSFTGLEDRCASGVSAATHFLLFCSAFCGLKESRKCCP